MPRISPCQCGHRVAYHHAYAECQISGCSCEQYDNGCEHPHPALHLIPAQELYCNQCQARVAKPWELCDDCGLRLDEHSPTDFGNLTCSGFRKPSPTWLLLHPKPIHLPTPTPALKDEGILREESLMAQKYTLPDGREYIARKLGGFEDDVQGLRELARLGVHVHLNGAPGVGKTALVMAAFPDCENAIGHGKLTAFDMMWVARIDPTTEHGVVYDPSPLTRAVMAGKPFYFDEIMRTPPDALTPLFSAMDGRGFIVGGNLDGTDLPIAPGFHVISASNPEVRGAFMPEAITSRFHILDMEVDEALLKKLNLDQRLMVAWQNMGKLNGGDHWQPSVRELLAAQKFIDIGNMHQAAYALTGWRVPARDRASVAGVISSLFAVRVPDLGGVIK